MINVKLTHRKDDKQLETKAMNRTELYAFRVTQRKEKEFLNNWHYKPVMLRNWVGWQRPVNQVKEVCLRGN